MASKPRSEWSDAYRKRIESAERRGLSRTAARGHANTPERPSAVKASNESKYRIYQDKRTKLADQIVKLKKDIYGSQPGYLDESARRHVLRDGKRERGIKELERILKYLKAVDSHVAGEVNIEDYLTEEERSGLYYK